MNEWHCRIDMYQDSEATHAPCVRQNIETLMQITDELFDALKPAYVQFVAQRLEAAKKHIQNLLAEPNLHNRTEASKFLNFINSKEE